MALARRDDAEPRVRHVEDLAIDRIGGSERERRGLFSLESLLDLRAREIGPAVVQARLGNAVVGRYGELRVRLQLDRHCGLDGFGDGFESDPHARVAGQREAVQAVVQVLGDIRRVQPRHHEREKRDVGLMRHRRRHATVVVTGNNEHAASRGAAVGVAVLECIAGAIDARALAVPHAEHAIDLSGRVCLDLLRTEHGSCGKVFVDGRQEFDTVLCKKGLRAPEFEVDHAERRAAVAADEAGRIEAGSRIHGALHERNADERLRAGQQDASRLAAIAVDEFIVVEHDRTVSRNTPGKGCQSSRSEHKIRYNLPIFRQERDSFDVGGKRSQNPLRAAA